MLGLALFIGQAFLYNAVYFTQAWVLARFFGISSATAGGYLIPLALGSLVGPLVLSRLFEGVMLSAATLAVAWSVVFFLASSGGSAAYFTVSEVFPMAVRALAIAIFYSVGTGSGGIVGPALFGRLVETGWPATSRSATTTAPA